MKTQIRVIGHDKLGELSGGTSLEMEFHVVTKAVCSKSFETFPKRIRPYGVIAANGYYKGRTVRSYIF